MELKRENQAPIPISALEYEVDKNPDKILEDENYTKEH